MRYSISAVVIAAMPILAACASIGTRPIRTHDKIVRESTEEVLVDGPGKPTATLDHLTLRFKAVGLCQSRSIRDLEEIQTSERYMKGNYAWYVGGAGLAALTAGSIGMVDATNVYADDTSSRTYNPEGRDKAFLANGALLATGVAAGTLLLVDLVRASGTEETVTPKATASDPVGDVFPCASKVLGNEPVVAIFGQEQKVLGSTNSAGSLEIDLDEALPSTLTSDKIQLALRGTTVATIDVTAVQETRAEELWARLRLDQCQQPTVSSACDQLKAYLRRFPARAHSAEANQILSAAEPALARLLDDETWQSIDTPCRDASFQASDEGVMRCLPFRQYLEQYPNGVHAAETRRLLVVADRKIAELAANEKAAEKKERLEHETAQRAEAAAAATQCQATCRVECRSPQIDDQVMCARGCYASRCGEGDACLGGCNIMCSSNRFYGDHVGCFQDCRISRGCGK